MDWRLRILRGVLYSQLPFAGRLRAYKRRLSPPTEEGANAGFAVSDGLRQLALLRDAGVPPAGRVIEVGTGWLPIIPTLYRIAGFGSLMLTDTEQLISPQAASIAAGAIRRRMAEVTAGLNMTEAQVTEALARPFDYDYAAPWDAEATPAASADLLFSRCVFEHVRPREVEHYFGVFRRIVRPGGWMCHTIDNSDHIAHINPAHSPVGFLAWPEGGLKERFAALNHYGYNNRLRHSDYLAILRRAGWEVVVAAGEPDERSLADLNRLRLAPPFDTREHRDLAILGSDIIVRNPG
jgi:hypothetical protein